jgi:hypothetical protein
MKKFSKCAAIRRLPYTQKSSHDHTAVFAQKVDRLQSEKGNPEAPPLVIGEFHHRPTHKKIGNEGENNVEDVGSE